MRYLLFAGERYYAHGGANDYVDNFLTLNGATTAADILVDDARTVVWANSRNGEYEAAVEWAHVLDISTGEIVYKAGEGPHGDDKIARIA